ncbi:hypothetical protein C7212DRAFT_361940 [Tuber magnatum]|uniref:Uncharacterized protein n=1 Tax=Tuber magnatum TaxID=42249 RepID=A0A317SYC0_9PEZI|nr:hypothetical protein C7212DRAFT_361940 [Tuber magnatum]
MAPKNDTMQKFNEFMIRLNRLLSNPGGIDKVLMTTHYTLALLPPSALSSTRSTRISIPKLTSLISDVRMFMRLWGLIGIYTWGLSTLSASRPSPIEIAQVFANTCFQICENVAYLSSHGIVRIRKKTEGQLWLWSSRFWMAHVALEFVRLFGGGRRGKGWEREVLSNCAYAPLTVHYSVDGGAIGPEAIAACGSVAAVIGLQNEWRKTV